MLLKKIKIALSLGALTGLTLLSSCSKDDTDPVGTNGNTNSSEKKNIVEIASGNSDLSSLVEALTEADLVSALEAKGPFTVFAPNNKAFQDLLASNDDWNTIKDIDKATLKNVLLFHVLGSEVKSSALEAGYVNTLATAQDNNLSLQVATDGMVKFNGTTGVVKADVDASNGVVHIVDKVMLPPSLVNLVENNPDFSILKEALIKGGLVDALKADGPFTVFAPNNAAFTKLLASKKEWNSLDDIPNATLVAVLKYHVVPNANVQSKDLKAGDITMLGSGKVTVDLTDGAKLKTSSNQTVKIIATDVQGTNGVVHVIEDVLVPGA